MTEPKTAAIQTRGFRESDIRRLVEILELNGQYGYPDVEGPDAMKRVAACEAAVFIVAEASGLPCGFIRGVYDGSRALIHLLSVHPDFHHAGIGTALVQAASAEFCRRGAVTISVTVTDKSSAFWKKQGFRSLPITVMLKEKLP